MSGARRLAPFPSHRLNPAGPLPIGPSSRRYDTVRELNTCGGCGGLTVLKLMTDPSVPAAVVARCRELWASGRDHLDPRQLHVVWGLGHVFVRLRLVSRNSHAGDFDLVADMGRQIGGRRYHSDRLGTVAFHVVEH